MLPPPAQLQHAGGDGRSLSCGRHNHLSRASWGDKDVRFKVKLLLLRKSFQEFLMLEAGGASPLLGCPKRHSPVAPDGSKEGLKPKAKPAFHLILVSQGHTPLRGV